MTDLREPFVLSDVTLGCDRSGALTVVAEGGGEPPAVDGLEIGAPIMSRSPHHGGERHPDGDELVFLVSGLVTLVLETEEGERRLGLSPGHAFIVPRGLWHRVEFHEPSQIFYMTPGPNSEHRAAAGD